MNITKQYTKQLTHVCIPSQNTSYRVVNIVADNQEMQL